jgi:hypothetical protein
LELIKLFVCLECGYVFEDPIIWEELYPYGEGYAGKKMSGCPSCYGAYTKAYRCDCCDEWIVDDYIKIEDKRYCQECYQSVELGRE